MSIGFLKKCFFCVTVTILLATPFLTNQVAKADTMSWNGYNWNLTGATAAVDGSGNLILSADGTFHSYSGKVTGGAGLNEANYFLPGSVDSFTASFIDSGASNQASWAVVKMEYSDGTAGFAMLGNPLYSSNYIAVWGFREAIGGDAPWTASWSMILGARTPGLHTSQFIRNSDGSTQLWFDGALVKEQSQVLMSAFQVMTLVNQNVSGGDSSSLLTDVQVSGGDSVPEPTSMLLFGSGMAGLAAWRRRQAKNNKS